MTNESGTADPFWDGVLARVRAAESGRRLSLVEAERRLAAGAVTPLDAGTIERLVRRATAPVAPPLVDAAQGATVPFVGPSATALDRPRGALRALPRRIGWAAAAAFFAFCLTTSSSSEQVVRSWQDGVDLAVVMAALDNEFDVESRQHGFVFVSGIARSGIVAMDDAGIADASLEARVAIRRGWLLAVLRDETAAPHYSADTVPRLRAAVLTLGDPSANRNALEAAVDSAAEDIGALIGVLWGLVRLDESQLDSAESAWVLGDGESTSAADTFRQVRASLERLLDPPSGN